MTDDAVIRFQAQVAKVQTLADGGIRIILDLPENAIETASLLMESKRQGALLEVAAVPLKYSEEQDAVQEGTERESKWTTAQEPGAD